MTRLFDRTGCVLTLLLIVQFGIASVAASCTEVSRCVTCSNAAPACVSCTENWGLKADGADCRQCQDANCKRCEEAAPETEPDVMSCVECMHGYGLRRDNTCLQCSTEHCETCDVTDEITPDTTCTSCDSRGVDGVYYYLDSDNTCQECPANCLECSVSVFFSGQCDLCVDGYILNAANRLQCLGCPAGCATCTGVATPDGAESECSACNPGFYLTNERCVACQLQCAVCIDETTCSECTSGFYLTTEGLCEGCPDSCTSCAVSTQQPQPDPPADPLLSCSSCLPGFGLTYSINDHLLCQECPSNCLTCRFGQHAPECFTCSQGYGLTNDRTNCLACRVLVYDNCMTCGIDDVTGTATCLQCDVGYTLREDGGACIECSHLECESCVDPGWQCSECEATYHLTSDKHCTHLCHSCGSSDSFGSEELCGPASSINTYGTENCITGTCWVHRRESGAEVTYHRGCSNHVTSCSSSQLRETCERDELGVQTCSKCCEGNLCNGYTLDGFTESSAVTHIHPTATCTAVSLLLALLITCIHLLA